MAYIPSGKESVVTHSASTRPGIPTTGSWPINAAASLTHYYYFYIYDEVLGPMVMRVNPSYTPAVCRNLVDPLPRHWAQTSVLPGGRCHAVRPASLH